MRHRNWKPGTLALCYDKTEDDFVAHHPDHKWNSGYLLHAMCGQVNGYGRTFVEELEHRGFDTRTLRVTVLKRKNKREGGDASV